MRRTITRWLQGALRRLQTQPAPPDPRVGFLADALEASQARELSYRRQYVEREHEMIEARQMAGSGPWRPASAESIVESTRRLKETNPISSMGAYGDIELALQNVEWRREINLTWLEFSRWGIQQIMLICRLYYIKNPIIRRLIDVCGDYVFARGVEISSPDKSTNDAIKEFLDANKATLGQHALTELEKRKTYDGNIFHTLFTDTQNTGGIQHRTIDPLEIQDIVCDPDDAMKPWYYRRVWTQHQFDPTTGVTTSQTQEAWYPAIDYNPSPKPKEIGGKPVNWDSPVYHRKSGHIGGWKFGCPPIYPAIDWARASKDMLTSVATVKQALAQIAMVLTTKGGQQAIEGAKQQWQTQVGPGGGQSLWDGNPAAVHGSTFASGPGTTIEAFKTQGAGGNPEEVRQYKLQCCMVMGVPETFLGDVSTGNLATATSLDRPTETGFLARQEAWIEDLTAICTYAIKASAAAPNGKIREAMSDAGVDELRVVEMRREKVASGRFEYFPAAGAGLAEAKKAARKKATLEVKVSFPAIREGDIPALVGAVVNAMTLANKGGQIVGIDEKEGVRKLFELLDIQGADEIIEEMYPSDYDPDRTKEDLDEPIGKALPMPGGQPQLPGGKQVKPEDKPVTAEALRGAFDRLLTGLRILEARIEDERHATNGRG